MGYILPNMDQRCLRQPCPRERWAVGKVADALKHGMGVGPGGNSCLFSLDTPEKEGGQAGVPEA